VVLPNDSDGARQHGESLAAGEHFFDMLGTRAVPAPDGHLAMELDLRPDLTNVRGALQGGLIAVLIDVCAGSLAYRACDHEQGWSTATSDLTIHYLSPVATGPARAEARILRRGRSTFVLQVDVTDEGRDGKLAAVATIGFTVLAPTS
jgi:uncharacterized protein (TIGR00369 family)